MKELNDTPLTLNAFFPHKRVCNTENETQEIFDLYQLGLFSAPDSFLANHIEKSIQNAQPIYENLELVELQPESSYKPHFHQKSAAVIYIISGAGDFLLGDVNMKYHSGMRMVIPAGVLHGFKTHTRTLFLSIQSPPIIDPDTQNIDLQYEMS